MDGWMDARMDLGFFRELRDVGALDANGYSAALDIYFKRKRFFLKLGPWLVTLPDAETLSRMLRDPWGSLGMFRDANGFSHYQEGLTRVGEGRVKCADLIWRNERRRERRRRKVKERRRRWRAPHVHSVEFPSAIAVPLEAHSDPLFYSSFPDEDREEKPLDAVGCC